MKYILFLLLYINVFSSCAQIKNEVPGNIKKEKLAYKLQEADLGKNVEQINSLITDDAIILYPDSPPFVGREAIISLYQFLWENEQVKTISYEIVSCDELYQGKVEQGNYHFENTEGKKVSLDFEVRISEVGGKEFISSICYGNTNLDNIKTSLPKPTGIYSVGQTNYFYERNETSNGRLISFQAWYPTNRNDGETCCYQNKDVIKASANFLGWPYFQASFFSLIKSNSYKNAGVIDGYKFPVLIYNHGYGGFSPVYQTVFEELASHGYIVISLGHENESALLIKGDGVIPNSPENEFYRTRNGELNGEKVNNLQSVILYSDDHDKINTAYKEYVELSPLHKESTELWASDTKEVIAKLKELNQTGAILKESMNLENIGVFGHSVGGATAGELAYNCKEIKAGINLDGFQFGNLINHSIEIPFMFVCSNPENNRYLRVSSFKQQAQNDFYHTVIKGFSHDNFSDLSFTLYQNQRAIEIQRSLILDFFDKYVKRKDINLDDLESEFNEIEFK